MAKTETVVAKKKKEEPVVPKPGDELVESWNRVVGLLMELEEAWREHRVTYLERRNEIIFLHPLEQRILKRVVQKQPFHFFLDDIARDARTGINKLLIKRTEV